MAVDSDEYVRERAACKPSQRHHQRMVPVHESSDPFGSLYNSYNIFKISEELFFFLLAQVRFFDPFPLSGRRRSTQAAQCHQKTHTNEDPLKGGKT